MPSWFDDSSPPPSSGSSWFDNAAVTPTQAAESEDGFSLGGTVLGGAALLGAAAISRNPSLLGKFFRGANAVRQQAMLSGMALPKSLLGNTGAVLNTAMEQRSISPIKHFFSRQTLDDAVDAYKTGGSAGPTPGVNLPGPNPGKIMGAFDSATRKSLVRDSKERSASQLTSMTPDKRAKAIEQMESEAQRSVLQSPLTGELGDVLESPAARYVIPFRRTPFNQFTEGWRTMKPGFEHSGVRNAYVAAGAAHGAGTAEEQYPVSIPLATALAAKYGLPYALAAYAARKLTGGQGEGGILGSALPVSEYGVGQSLSDPTAPFVRPAISRFFE